MNDCSVERMADDLGYEDSAYIYTFFAGRPRICPDSLKRWFLPSRAAVMKSGLKHRLFSAWISWANASSFDFPDYAVESICGLKTRTGISGEAGWAQSTSARSGRPDNISSPPVAGIYIGSFDHCRRSRIASETRVATLTSMVAALLREEARRANPSHTPSYHELLSVKNCFQMFTGRPYLLRSQLFHSC